MAKTVPCSICGDERPWSRSVRPAGEMVCHPCRRDIRNESERVRREKWAQIQASRSPRKRCADCGAKSKGSSTLPQGKYRCQSCRRADPRRKCDDPEYRRQYNASHYQRTKRQKRNRDHMARARRYGVEFEIVDELAVFERDKWRCGICGEPVNKRLVAPHILSASLDHVVPMSKGGSHTSANAQCAHWICNCMKTNKGDGGEQLALIG